MSEAEKSPVDTIPDPEVIIDRMAQIARERMLLKALLRLAKQKKEYERQQRPEKKVQR
jgi:hypothetical protein